MLLLMLAADAEVASAAASSASNLLKVLEWHKTARTQRKKFTPNWMDFSYYLSSEFTFSSLRDVLFRSETITITLLGEGGLQLLHGGGGLLDHWYICVYIYFLVNVMIIYICVYIYIPLNVIILKLFKT
jgi:hypothetical protein